MTVAWDLIWGGSRSAKHYDFPGKVVAAGDERQLVCAVVAGALVSMRDWFLQGVLKRAFVHVCVVKGCFGIFDCRSQCAGCMIVVMFCCHVRRYMRV